MEKYPDFEFFNNERLQISANFVIGRLAAKYNGVIDSDVINCQYVNGSAIKIPKWILQMNGHKLEELYRSAFDEFRRYNHPGALYDIIFKKVLSHLPCFISSDLFDTYHKIHG